MEYGTAEEMQMNRVDGDGNAIDIANQHVFKVEVAANRYDLLCLEGIAAAFRVYLGLGTLPRYSLKNESEALQQIIVKPETAAVRPFVVGCVLRDIRFDVSSYNSFIDLQDKLHQNICRRRQLASMGTHDLDKVRGPVTYEAQAPSEIVFQALKQSEAMDANALFEVFRSDIKMKKFLPILEPFEKYPVFRDADGHVLSLPPIINSERTKITLDTRNVFVEITGTDIMKTKVCLAVLAAQFSEHCQGEWKHKVEQVQITYEGAPDKSEVTPSLEYTDFDVELEYINRILGLSLDAEQVKTCAEKMGLVMKGTSEDGKSVKVEIPPTRADILHPCDVMEDIGIGYGFNNIERVFPANNTVGAYQPNNKFADLLRGELAQAGYVESLTFSLLSIQDNYRGMRQEPNLAECVQLSNPKTQEFEVVRTSLLPGLLKCLYGNRGEQVPQKLFEVSDTVVLDPASETGAKNVRKLAALVIDIASNFEVIHGLLDLLMVKVGADFEKRDYQLVEDDKDARFFPGRGYSVLLKGTKVGSIGVLHPEVLANFDLKFPVSALELDFEPLFAHFKAAQ